LNIKEKTKSESIITPGMLYVKCSIHEEITDG